MNESNRQKATTQPQRPVAGSVPVLFSVRNVQPRIVGAITQPNPGVGTVSDDVPTSLASEAKTPALATPVSNPIKTRVPSTNNRVYNTAVGLLVIALCLLVIRNTQGSKSDSKETIASNAAIPVAAIPVAAIPVAAIPVAAIPVAAIPVAAIPVAAIPVEIKPQSNLKVELVPPALPNEMSFKPFDLESASALVPASTPSISLVSSSSEVTDSAPPGPPLAQSNPPMLLQSKVPSQVSAQEEGFVEPVRSDLGIETVPKGLPGIVDTNSPSLTTRDLLAMKNTQELIDLRRHVQSPATSNSLYGQPYQSQGLGSGSGVPAMNVWNATPVSNMPTAVPDAAIPSVSKPLYSVGQDTKDPSILAGRPYSSQPQEFPSLTVPNYEREANLNRQGSPTGTQNSLPIRQPATKEANRYPTTTQTPYAPLQPQVQNGSSFGYPPGK